MLTQVDALDIIHCEQCSCQASRLIAGHKNRQWVMVQQLADPGKRTDGRDTPLRHHRHVLGQLLEFLEFVTRNQKTLAPLCQVMKKRKKLLPAYRVDPAQRLVE